MLDKVRPGGLATPDRNTRDAIETTHRLNSQTSTPIQARLAGSTVCTAAGLKVDTGSPVLAICRKLVNAGHHPDRALEAFRGSTLCLRVRSIGEAAGLEINGHGTGFKQLRDGGAGLPVSLNGGRGIV